jgi:hypothetical protein
MNIRKNYDFNSYSVELGQPPFPNFNDDYPHIAKEKVLESANKIYNELIKGLVDTTISTAVWVKILLAQYLHTRISLLAKYI